MANARDDPVTASSWGRSWLSSIKLMWNVYRSKHLDLCWFECFKLVLRNQNKTLSSLHAVSQVPMLNQVSPPVVWLLINRDVRLIRYKLFTSSFPWYVPFLRYCFKRLIPNYLFNFSFFILHLSSPTPAAQPVNQPHFMTGGCDVRPVAGGRLGVWPHLVPWHLVRLKREEISWLSEMLSPRHRSQACQTEL